jgi:hypothetical protein
VNGTSYIAACYVKWLESGGPRVVPILSEHISSQGQSVNGLLFTGGSASLFTWPLTTLASGASSSTLSDSNDEGVYYPLWATSFGFELINVCISPDPNTISTFSGEPAYTARVKFTKQRGGQFDSTLIREAGSRGPIKAMLPSYSRMNMASRLSPTPRAQPSQTSTE